MPTSGDPQKVHGRVLEAVNSTRAGVRTPNPGPLRSQADGNGIRVAVMDAWPLDSNEPRNHLRMLEVARQRLETRLQSDPEGRPWAMKRIAEAAAGLLGNPATPLQFFDTLLEKSEFHDVNCYPERASDGEPLDRYPIPDHGLFVADILTDVAPNVELSVYRVLDDRAMGDMNTVGHAVRQAIDEADGQPLIINLSLGFGPPLLLGKRLLEVPAPAPTDRGDYHVVSIFRDPRAHIHEVRKEAPSVRERERSIDHRRALLETDGLVEKVADDTYRLAGPFAALEALLGGDRLPTNVLIVASAGNLSNRPNQVWDPMVPAVIDGVIGVSALDGDNEYAFYSNADELLPLVDGIATFGGSAGRLSGYTTPGEGVVGLYVSANIPPDPAVPGPANEYGWAMWSGTSFATPVISGLAACIWQELEARRIADGLTTPVTAVDVRNAITALGRKVENFRQS